MENQNIPHREHVKKVIEEIFTRMGILCELEIHDGDEGLRFAISSTDPVFLRSDVGKNIAALNNIVRRIVEKELSDAPEFLIDINDVQKKHAEEIKDSARMHAQRVRYFKKDIEMRPMNAYERRLVHMVLQEYPDIETESVGEGFERRVVVKPVSLG